MGRTSDYTKQVRKIFLVIAILLWLEMDMDVI